MSDFDGIFFSRIDIWLNLGNVVEQNIDSKYLALQTNVKLS